MEENGRIMMKKICFCRYKIVKKRKYKHKIQAKKVRGKEKNMCAPLDLLREETAEHLIENYGLDEKIPVNLDKLLEACGIIVEPTDFNELKNFPDIVKEEKKYGTILGAVAIQDDDLKILYRKSDSRHRQKFTIAHELAHCCLDSDSLKEYGHIEYRRDIAGYTKDKKEKAANTFAGELLIPKTALDKIYAKIDNPDLDVLANVFDVSRNVMRERLKKLNLSYKENIEFYAYHKIFSPFYIKEWKYMNE